jgi:hypothetical protein
LGTRVQKETKIFLGWGTRVHRLGSAHQSINLPPPSIIKVRGPGPNVWDLPSGSAHERSIHRHQLLAPSTEVIASPIAQTRISPTEKAMPTKVMPSLPRYSAGHSSMVIAIATVRVDKGLF